MHGPDLRQLRYFVAVGEELHFSRAAERLGMAQPPLTQQIQKLETQLGCQLLTRGRTTSLTTAGAILLEQSRGLLAHVDSVLEATRRAARGETGRLVIGVPPSVMLSGLPTAISKYRARFPGVALRLREMSTSAIEHAVALGEIDLGFLREAAPGHPLASRAIYQEPVMAVLPKSHPLAAHKSVCLSSLQKDPFVFFPKQLGPAFFDRLISLCAEAGFTPTIAVEATQWQSVIALVEAGMGVTLAPGCMRKFRSSHVVFRSIPRATTTVTACWRAAELPPSAAAFLKLAKAHLV